MEDHKIPFKPDFFIVGAPKCGTTALAHYLQQHPEVGFSRPKEPHFFMSPAGSNRQIRSEQRYARCFPGSSTSKRYGEGSVWYLYSDHARRQILERNPSARIIIMIRDRESFFLSLHNQLALGSRLPIPSPETSWDRPDPEGVSTLEELDQWKFHFRELVQFEKYIERWVADFGEEKVLVVNTSMSRIDHEVYDQVCDFLGINRLGEGEIDFRSVNSRRSFPRWWVWFREVSRVRRLSGFLQNAVNFPSLGILRKIEKVLSRPAGESVKLEARIRNELPPIAWDSLPGRKVPGAISNLTQQAEDSILGFRTCGKTGGQAG